MAAPRSRLSPPVRIGLFFGCLYVTTGVYSPYLSVWLRAGGLSGGEIGAIMAAPLLARAAVGPLLAHWADRFQLRRTPILWMALSAAVLFAAMMATRGFWAWFVLWFAGSSLFSACSPLADVIALRRASQEGFPYAFARGIGSAAYIVANMGAGALIAPFGAGVVMIWTTAGAILSTVCAPILLPRERVAEAAVRPEGKGGMRALLGDPRFMLAVMSVGLIQAGHAFYYSFSTLVWRAQGLGAPLIGVLWGVGVGAEVVFLYLGEGVRRRLGPQRMLILGGLGAVARWTAFAFSPPVWLLFPLQALHALSFTATFIASLQLVERLSPPEHASAAQSLNAALYSGVLIGAATLASGPLFDHAGAYGYLAMSLLAAAGLAGAIRLNQLLRTQAP